MKVMRKFFGATLGVCVVLSAAAAVAQSARVAGMGETMKPANRGVVCLMTSAAENANGAAETNAVRRSKGLSQLRPDKRLAEAAARHACDMAQRDQMTHKGSRSKGPSQRVRAAGYKMQIVAENIGKGFSEPEQVMSAWVASSGHLQNILLPQVRDFGIGKAVAADGRTVYWAAVYAAGK
ncbi:CAP domain-containing protein [Paracoccus sp. (in: a-proteobacteria)]|uniref:CAP domain-containing protein n=1 Tax=Paracoccus sp. TaxID=267 RepID=UPI002897816D|nr:CAP domain-containing protein [Paracoccus sp. (in: a-proteobacteria)]